MINVSILNFPARQAFSSPSPSSEIRIFLIYIQMHGDYCVCYPYYSFKYFA